MKEILLSVALPMYSAQSIAWLAMESLCRQECDFEWELLIAEETYPGSNFFGFANVVFRVSEKFLDLLGNFV